jgi:hypothetical protein
MAKITHHYCGHCGRYIGNSPVSRCPYCGKVFNISEKLGQRTIVETKINLKPLTYTAIATVGAGTCAVTSAITISWLSKDWASFFSSLATSLAWQVLVTTIFFSVSFSVLRGIFWEQIDHFLLARDKFSIYNFLQSLRRILYPLASHRRVSIILLLLFACIVTLLILPSLFGRPLDVYDNISQLVLGVLGSLFVLVIEDLIHQKEKIKKDKEAPATIDEWKRLSNR